MKIKLYISFAFLTILMSSCLRNGSNTYKVLNGTQHSFYFSSVIAGDTSTFKSEPGSTYIFYSETGIGVEVPKADEFLVLFDEIFIEVDDTLNCIKDLYLYDSWIHQFSGNTATHTLQIDSLDIQ